MKGKSKWLLFFCIIFLGYVPSLKAQDTPPPPLPPLNFTLNVGYGLPDVNRSYYQSQGIGSNGGCYNPIYLEIGCKYAKKGLVSLYLSDATEATGNYTWLDTLSATHIYSYTVSIITMGISTKYYFMNGEHFAPYMGGMLSYCFVNFNEVGDFPAFGAANVNVTSLAYHIYAGSSYYFNSWLGLDARIGYGNSYYAGIGLSFKFKIKQEDD